LSQFPGFDFPKAFSLFSHHHHTHTSSSVCFRVWVAQKNPQSSRIIIHNGVPGRVPLPKGKILNIVRFLPVVFKIHPPWQTRILLQSLHPLPSLQVF
jgi:hypothetical protein